MVILQDVETFNNIPAIRAKAEAVSKIPQATEDISMLARMLVKSCDRASLDQSQCQTVRAYCNRLGQLMKRDQFESTIHVGAFDANARGPKS